jgi:transcriptional regulator with XRE-family HTH domain
MPLDALIDRVRRRSGLSLRELAKRAGTSHATLSAYEHGRVSPTIDTVMRVAAASGYVIEIRLVPLPADANERGRELEAVLDLAGEFPARHERRPQMPVFGRRPATDAGVA